MLRVKSSRSVGEPRHTHPRVRPHTQVYPHTTRTHTSYTSPICYAPLRPPRCGAENRQISCDHSPTRRPRERCLSRHCPQPPSPRYGHFMRTDQRERRSLLTTVQYRRWHCQPRLPTGLQRKLVGQQRWRPQQQRRQRQRPR